MPRYENFIKVAIGMFVAATALVSIGFVFDVTLLTVLGAFVGAVAWVLLLAGLIAGALRPLITASGRDVAMQLAQLASLHDSGKLSNGEFAAAKRRCLES